MFLSLQTYITAILISVIAVQYAFALFCLLKLAFFDISKKEYVLWNLLILLVFFVGGAAFLVYYFKHPDKHISKQPEASDPAAQTAEEKSSKELDGEANAASSSVATESENNAVEPQNDGKTDD